MPPRLTPLPLELARSWMIRDLERGKTVLCPCCNQKTKIYKRPLGRSSTRALVCMYLDHGLDFGHLPTTVRRLGRIAHQGGYMSLASWWGLLEESAELRPDGGRAGWWRVTDLGERWLYGEVTIPKYVRSYGGVILEHLGPDWAVTDALKESFDLREILNGSPGFLPRWYRAA